MKKKNLTLKELNEKALKILTTEEQPPEKTPSMLEVAKGLYLDREDWEKEQAWHKIREKWGPLIIKAKLYGYSADEIKDLFYKKLQRGEIGSGDFLVMFPEMERELKKRAT